MNIYLPKKTEIIGVRAFPFNKKLFIIDANLHFIPGQFIELSIPGIGEFPVSICSAPYEKKVEFCIKKMGRVTSYLFKLNKKDIIGYRGPFGNGFPMNELKNKDIVVIAGGIGILPLRSFIKEIIHNDDFNTLKILYGAKEPDDMLFRDEIKKWRRHAMVLEIFEKGGGRTGLVSDLINEAEIEGNEYAIVCGPPAMFVPVIKKLIKGGIEEDKIFLSVERRMKCGIGKCGHCIAGSYYVCIDGPIFRYSQFKSILLQYPTFI